jgi:hypothetical protein
MKAATSFVRQHQVEIAGLPTWLFSRGPVGPKPLPGAAGIAEFRKVLNVRATPRLMGLSTRRGYRFRKG